MHTVTVQGTDIPELRAQLIAEAPTGWDMIYARVEMKSGVILIVTGKFECRHEPTEIEAEDIDALRAKVPEGWQMLSVRQV